MRKLFLLFAVLCGLIVVQAQEIDAVKVTQGGTTDWHRFDNNNRIHVSITNGNPVFPEKTYDLAQGNVTTAFGTAPADTWYTVRTDGVANNWNTICLEKNITAIDGATFWTVTGQTDNAVILDEITEPAAGQGYIIRFTANELKVKYGDQVAATPVAATAANPIQGTYTQIEPNMTTGENSVLKDNYVVYGNELRLVGLWVGLLAHRAYVVKDLIPNGEPTSVPVRQRAYMPKPKETATELKSKVESQKSKDGKYIINDRLVIIRDGKRYNALGMKF